MRRLVLFVAITFGLAWPLQLLWPESLLARAIAGCAPSLAALAVGYRPRFRPVSWGWVGAGFCLGPALGVLGVPAAIQAPYVPGMILPPVGEELGWRGFLREQKVPAIAVGVLWALWHIPVAGHEWKIYLLHIFLISPALTYLATRGGVAAAIAAHAGINAMIVVPRFGYVVAPTVFVVSLILLSRREKWNVRVAC
jgi:hypothetical protein